MHTSRSRAFVATLAVLLTLFLIGGCTSSRWQYVRDRPVESPVTRVTVITEPAGAEVSVNGDYQDESPVVIPVRYRRAIRVYERREALPYPHVEEREVPVYSGNVFRFEANMVGHEPATERVTVNGEEEKRIVIRLRKRRD